MADYEWAQVTLGQNDTLTRIAGDAAKASALLDANLQFVKIAFQLGKILLLGLTNPQLLLLVAIADEIDNFVKYGVKITYNEQVNQLFWPEQNATDQLIPPIITEVEIELESILDSIRE